MKYRLENICSFGKDRINTASLTCDNYISTENMLPNKAGVTKATSLPTVAQTQQYSKGDVLVSNIRPYFKKIWLADNDGGCSNDVLVFKSKNNIDKRYLYYVLANDDFFNYSMATSKGTKMPRGDKASIMAYMIERFNLDVQERIGATLGAIDDKITLNERINRNLHQQSVLLVDHLLSELTEFETLSLSEVADCQNGRAFYKEGYDEEGAFVIDLGNVNTSGTFIYTSADKYISR